MNLSLLNIGCRDESKGCTTFFTDICAVCLDDVWSLTPFNRPTFMSFLTPRTFPGLFTLFLRPFEAIGGWGTTAVLTVHVETSFEFSDPGLLLLHQLFQTLDDRDDRFRVVLYQCKNIVTFHDDIT